MTDPSNPSVPNIPRRKTRDPATIDLPSRVVDEGRPATEPTASEADRITEAVAIEMAAPVQPDTSVGTLTGGSEPPPPDAVGEVADNVPPPEDPTASPRQAPPFALLLVAALLGGVVAAGLLFAWQTLRPGQENPRLTTLERRIAALPPAESQTEALQALTSRIQALEDARAATEQRLTAAQNAAEQALSRPVAPASEPQDQAAIADLTQRLAALEGQIGAGQQALASSRQALEMQVQALSERVSQETDEVTKVAVRLVLAQRLGESLRQGAPYGKTLDALRASGVEVARLPALEPFADKGAPTAAALAREFQPLAETILREDRGEAGSFTDRLLRMAERVVTIRAVDKPGSTDTSSLVARIEQALQRGDVQESVSTWETLPEPARRISEEWGSRAKARAAADSSVRAITDDAVAALSEPAR